MCSGKYCGMFQLAGLASCSIPEERLHMSAALGSHSAQVLSTLQGGSAKLKFDPYSVGCSWTLNLLKPSLEV